MEVENPGKWAISLLVGAALVAVGWRYPWVLVTLHVFICLLLCVVVLLQSGKAADLAGAFGGAGSQTAFGPRGAANFLSRATTWCAIMFMATSMVLVLHQSNAPGSLGSIFERLGSQTPPAQQKPAVPAQAPIKIPVPSPSGQPATAPQQQAPAQTAPPQPQAPAQSAPAPAKPGPSKP